MFEMSKWTFPARGDCGWCPGGDCHYLKYLGQVCAGHGGSHQVLGCIFYKLNLLPKRHISIHFNDSGIWFGLLGQKQVDYRWNQPLNRIKIVKSFYEAPFNMDRGVRFYT